MVAVTDQNSLAFSENMRILLMALVSMGGKMRPATASILNAGSGDSFAYVIPGY
jgi:hypothetical protein